MDDIKLPPLPEPAEVRRPNSYNMLTQDEPLYDAEAMQAYARQAVLMERSMSNEQILWHAGDLGLAIDCEPTDEDRTYTFDKEALLAFATAIRAQ